MSTFMVTDRDGRLIVAMKNQSADECSGWVQSWIENAEYSGWVITITEDD